MLARARNIEEASSTFGSDFNQQLDELAGNFGEPRWHKGNLPVDDSVAEFWFTEVGRGHAAVSDINDAVAVGIDSYGVNLTGMSLRTVNDVLDSYDVDRSITLGRGNEDRPRR